MPILYPDIVPILYFILVWVGLVSVTYVLSFVILPDAALWHSYCMFHVRNLAVPGKAEVD